MRLDRRADSPVTNGKRHGVSHQDDTGHCHPAELSVAINHVIDAESDAAGVGERQHAHGHDQAKPVDLVGSTHAPQEQRSWNQDQARSERPEPMLGLHDAAIATSQLDSQPVAEPTSEERPMPVNTMCRIEYGIHSPDGYAQAAC